MKFLKIFYIVILFFVAFILGEEGHSDLYWLLLPFLAIPLVAIHLGKTYYLDFKDMFCSNARKDKIRADQAFLGALFILAPAFFLSISFIIIPVIEVLVPNSIQRLLLDAYSIPFWLGVVVAPVLEEILFRGYLFGSLSKRWSSFRAAIFSSLVFGLLHGHNFLSAFLVGLLLCGLYFRYRTLWVPVALHVFNNFVSQMVPKPNSDESLFLDTTALNSILLWGLVGLLVSGVLLVYLRKLKGPFKQYFFSEPLPSSAKETVRSPFAVVLLGFLSVVGLTGLILEKSSEKSRSQFREHLLSDSPPFAVSAHAILAVENKDGESAQFASESLQENVELRQWLQEEWDRSLNGPAFNKYVPELPVPRSERHFYINCNKDIVLDFRCYLKMVDIFRWPDVCVYFEWITVPSSATKSGQALRAEHISFGMELDLSEKVVRISPQQSKFERLAAFFSIRPQNEWRPIETASYLNYQPNQPWDLATFDKDKELSGCETVKSIHYHDELLVRVENEFMSEFDKFRNSTAQKND